MSELDAVLNEFDKPASDDAPCAASLYLPAAYASGWRLAEVAQVLREALVLAKNQHNLSDDVYLPMQYLRSTVLAFLYNVSQHRLDPREASPTLMLRCLRDADFLGVISYYTETPRADLVDLPPYIRTPSHT